MTEAAYDKPVPDVDDPAMAPFWAAARERRLTAQQCTACHSYRFPALEICPTCLEQGARWADVSQEGVIWSFARYHRAFHPGFRDELPYVVAIVENAQGIHYVGKIVGPADRLAVGAKVRTVFLECTDRFTLPAWEIMSG
jgi:uncharacterized OB-fold protein